MSLQRSLRRKRRRKGACVLNFVEFVCVDLCRLPIVNLSSTIDADCSYSYALVPTSTGLNLVVDGYADGAVDLAKQLLQLVLKPDECFANTTDAGTRASSLRVVARIHCLLEFTVSFAGRLIRRLPVRL